MGEQSAAGFWDGVDVVWRECFQLAWESFQRGSIPIGAVLVDAGGAVVGRGRNRRAEEAGPVGQLAGSSVAHAEINALSGLSPGNYPDHVLYSTLEPCFLCTAALRHSHVGTVRFAAADPIWRGIEQLSGLNDHLARHWPRREGPVGGPLQSLATVLHLASALERDVGSALDCYRTATPAAVRTAEELVGTTADELRSGSLVDALNFLWPRLG